MRRSLHWLRSADLSVGLRLVDHFGATLFDQGNSKYAEEVASGAATRTTIMMALEPALPGYGFKTYFISRKLGMVEPT
ncbi:hypothetical protein ANO14919_129780 [Xylariales sp. No.14919]|nr:hypothetical protein ANO14919_129780 [Xylariales sp. No.14919]